MATLELINLPFIFLYISMIFWSYRFCKKEGDKKTLNLIYSYQGIMVFSFISLYIILVGFYIFYNARTEEETKTVGLRKGGWIWVWGLIIGFGLWMFIVGPQIGNIQF